MKVVVTRREKPIEAVQYDGSNAEEVGKFMESPNYVHDDEKILVATERTGNILVPLGYWVVLDEYGEYRVISNEVFQERYVIEAVE
jgi:hypothetical protein